MPKLNVLFPIVAIGCAPFEPLTEAEVTERSISVRHAVGEHNTITPVLFVPRDQSVEPGDIETINRALADVEGWYARELDGASLRMSDIAIVHGERTAQEYLDDDVIWGAAPAETREALGFSPWDPGHITVTMGKGLLGWAGANGNGQAGHAVVGLESLTRNALCAEEWWCTPEMWRGTVIHELGHALTLPHSESPSIMDFHGDYADRHLIETDAWPEVSTVRGLPFVDTGNDNTLAVCEQDVCPVHEVYDIQDRPSVLAEVPRGTRLGILGSTGGWNIASFAMGDRDNRLQVVSEDHGWSIQRPERNRTMMCMRPEGCAVFSGAEPASSDIDVLGHVDFGTKMGVLVRAGDRHVVSFPMTDRENDVQLVFDGDWVDITGKVQRHGRTFWLDGSTFRFVGVNQVGMPHYPYQDILPFADGGHIAVQLDAAQAAGASVIRVWIGNEQIDNDMAAERLSILLDAAERRDLKLIVSFIDFYGTGYRPAFTGQHYGVDPNGFVTIRPEFFRTHFRENYRNFVLDVVRRNQGRSGVFAWELGNEIRADGDPDAFMLFAMEMALEIKNIDRATMVSAGLQSSWHAGLRSEHEERMYAPGMIDFVTQRAYDTTASLSDQAIADANDVPFLVEEVGFSGGDRANRTEEGVDTWFEDGADGVMLWSLNGVPYDNGDADITFGAALFGHHDYQELVDTWRGLADVHDIGTQR